MPELVGHEGAMRLADPLPHSTLIVGPEGVGKRLAAELLVERSGAKSIDVQRCGSLDAEGAREMVRFHSSRPFGSVKVSVADVSVSSPHSANALLKLLEEPPPSSRLILHSDRTPLLTIASRCTQLRFGHLSVDEVAAVCRAQGMDEEQAQEAAEGSQGRPGLAMRWASRRDAVNAVRGILTAMRKGEAEALENALLGAMRQRDEESWRQLETRREQVAEMLMLVIRESVIGRDRVFDAADVALLKKVNSGSRYRALSTLSEASRPTLRVRSACWMLASGMEK